MEIWRDIEGFTGLYQVSDEGRVRSLKRLLPSAVANGMRVPVRVLKPGFEGHGRQQVTLCKEGKTTRYLVHRLVLKAFIGDAPFGMEAAFLDGRCTNLRLDNLTWRRRVDKKKLCKGQYTPN